MASRFRAGNPWDDLAVDLHVFVDQLQACFPRFLARAGGNDDQRAVGKIAVAPCPDLHGMGKGQSVREVHRLPLRPVPVDVQEDQFGKNTALQQRKGDAGAHKAAAYNGRLLNVVHGSPSYPSSMPCGGHFHRPHTNTPQAGAARLLPGGCFRSSNRLSLLAPAGRHAAAPWLCNASAP